MRRTAKAQAKPSRPRKKRRHRIYTCRGDRGETDVPALGRVRKDHPRLRLIGAVDELNCWMGELVVRLEAVSSGVPGRREAVRRCKRVQRELFGLGSLISGAVGGARGKAVRLGTLTRRLEREIDAMEEQLPACCGFVLPGGDAPVSASHIARAVCRRAERRGVSALAGEPLGLAIVRYLNRLSDWLFVAARWLLQSAGRQVEYWHQSGAQQSRGKRP